MAVRRFDEGMMAQSGTGVTRKRWSHAEPPGTADFRGSRKQTRFRRAMRASEESVLKQVLFLETQKGGRDMVQKAVVAVNLNWHAGRAVWLK